MKYYKVILDECFKLSCHDFIYGLLIGAEVAIIIQKKGKNN